ncbi:MAG: hypothetical protein NTW74_13655 [Acidobacteria bacterium]|nr:hypothetical protein [Acidobacteriota bacterium]
MTPGTNSAFVAVLLSSVFLHSCTQQRDSLLVSLLRQKTSAGKNLGGPELVPIGTTFRKNELVAIQIQLRETGYLYALQADDQGTYDVLYPPAAGSPSTPSNKQLRLPSEEGLWLGFISSSVTLAWSRNRIDSLEQAIDRSEVEKDSLRAIRDPQDVKQLEEILDELLRKSTPAVSAQRILLKVD